MISRPLWTLLEVFSIDFPRTNPRKRPKKEFQIEEVPEMELIQIFFTDPEGGRVEVASAGQLSDLEE